MISSFTAGCYIHGFSRQFQPALYACSLSGEDKALFLDFCNAYGELMGDAGLDSFLIGFRLGAKMIFIPFACSDDAPFESYLKDQTKN